jgi:hypothetical protein
MRLEYGKFRDSVETAPHRGKITFRAVANIVENVHLEGTVRGFRLESDEPGNAVEPISPRLRSLTF